MCHTSCELCEHTLGRSLSEFCALELELSAPMSSQQQPSVCWNCGAPAGSANSRICAECHASLFEDPSPWMTPAGLDYAAARVRSRPPPSACPNCGAPAGSAYSETCAQCHASFFEASPPCLTPAGLDYDAVTIPFIDRTISVLNRLNDEPVVRRYARAHPDACRAIVALSQAVFDIGIRAQRNGHDWDEHLRHFTAGEIWMVDLAVDVVTMFLDNGGLRGDGDGIASDLRRAEQHGHMDGRHWRKQVQDAGDGPEGFRGLRGRVPRRQPRR